MHELSIVMSILEIAGEQAGKAGAAQIEEIELDIGTLTSIEEEAFDFAWKQAVKGTALEKTVRTINRIVGEGRCPACQAVFPVNQLYDPCPECGEPFVELTHGKELRVKSLVIS